MIPVPGSFFRVNFHHKEIRTDGIDTNEMWLHFYRANPVCPAFPIVPFLER
jgi:hypothetical protein